MTTTAILPYGVFFAKRRKMKKKRKHLLTETDRSRLSSGAMKAIAPLYNVTALMWAAEFLDRCRRGPCDLTGQAGFIGRIVGKLGEIRQTETLNADQDRALETVIHYLDFCRNQPCDLSGNPAHIESLIDVIRRIQPGLEGPEGYQEE